MLTSLDRIITSLPCIYPRLTQRLPLPDPFSSLEFKFSCVDFVFFSSLEQIEILIDEI